MKEIRSESGEIVKVILDPCDTLEQIASRLKCDVYELIEGIDIFYEAYREMQE